MNFELQQIKKKYGENMAHLSRSLFPTILENEGRLLKLLESNFEPNKSLYDDLVENDLTMEFKDYIYGLLENKKEENVKTNKSPKELLSEAGYDLYECHSEEEIQSFKKYFAHGEELCTFKYGNRLDTDYVFFAVKKNVDDIKRDDFDEPQREDLYGTSVMSIQFSRGRVNTLSIKNRYNHTVKNPDATYGNNLDNIIPGLRDSFEKHYDFNINQCDVDINIPGYVKAKDKKYYKYNYELNGVYYCPNNIIIKNLEVDRTYQKPERYLVLDYFIVDLVDKKVSLYDRSLQDGLLETTDNIKNIEIRKIDDGDKKIIFNNRDNTSFEMTIDKKNVIKAYRNDNLLEVPERFLYSNKYLESLVLNNTKVISNECLTQNHDLCHIEVNNLETIGNYFLTHCYKLDEFIGNKVKTVGHYFLTNDTNCKKIEMENVEKIESNFLSRNRDITSIDFRELVEVGNCFIDCDTKLEKANLPKLKITKNSFLSMCNIRNIDLSNLKEVGSEFMTYDKVIESITLNNLEVAGHDLLSRAKRLKEFNAPKLRKVGNNCLGEVKIENLELNELESVGDDFLKDSSGLLTFIAPKLVTAGNNFMAETESIKKLVLEELKETGHSFLRFNEIIEEIITPKLEKTGYGFAQSSEKIKKIDVHNLKVIGEDSLQEYKVKTTDLPNLVKVIGYNLTDISNNPDGKFYNIIKRNRCKKDLFNTPNTIDDIYRRRI